MKTFLFSILLCAFLGSCGDNAISPPATVESSEYFPLQIGNKWKYQELVGSDIRDTLVLTVEGTHEYGGKTYFYVSGVHEGKLDFLTQEFYRIENSKVYEYNTYDSKEYLFVDFVNKDTTSGYVYETKNSVSSSVGIFDKVKNVTWYAAAWDAAPYKNSYAPNIGLLYSGQFYSQSKLIYAKIGDKIYQ